MFQRERESIGLIIKAKTYFSARYHRETDTDLGF